VLVPACRLLRNCAGVTVASTREQAAHLRSVVARNVFPDGYEPALPIFAGPQSCLAAARAGENGVACLRAPEEELRVVERWADAHAGSRRLVTITLRHYSYMVARNSNIPAWANFAYGLDLAKYFPVFIPDLSDTIEGPPAELRGFAVFGEAAWNLALRAALYERAFLNLGINNGPMGVCCLNARTRYAILKIETPSVPQATRKFIQSFGFELDKSLPFASPVQEWVWEDDTEEAIQRAFARLVARIEAGKAGP